MPKEAPPAGIYDAERKGFYHTAATPPPRQRRVIRHAALSYPLRMADKRCFRHMSRRVRIGDAIADFSAAAEIL